ncbi:hypothetical protein ACFOQM_02150 [Paenibacillus sp. GCM10012307]|uniref:Uncharacterized protein n=1 Tax=Paenibacillus roseus TaxID=2798579 RepID=A0A934IVL9_9BACL|nr:hypothetical protein [Paenibacillus roseus]MBJ6360121.1 hypothetical protein [Paenibacillus roseus]
MKRIILRKIISAIFSSVILSYFLVLIYGSSSFVVYFTIFCIGYLIIGVPCSIAAELISLRIKGNILGLLMGGIIHLIFAGMVIFWLALNDLEGFPSLMKYSGGIVYTVIVAAMGLWLIDTIFKHILRK